ncbi:hypothetical protein [Endozoicomonas sp. ALB091]|uniref:hypothetical protein n=1 Tax=Endozoicomonas sp. ALB091 TaxID=3403073 RepID=UPI003BB6A9CC
MTGITQFKPFPSVTKQPQPPVTKQPQPEVHPISDYTLNCDSRVKKDAVTTVGLIAGSTSLATVISGALSGWKLAAVIASALPVCVATTGAAACVCVCIDDCPCCKPLPERQVEHANPGYLTDEEQYITPGAEKR